MATPRLPAALIAAAWAVMAARLASGASTGEKFAQLDLDAAGKVYATGDVAKTLAKLTECRTRRPDTICAREAWLLSGRLMEHDLDEIDRALRTYRSLVLSHPRSPQGVVAQAHIALAYERSGKLAPAYREYLRLSKMPPLVVKKRYQPGSGESDTLKRGGMKRFPRVRCTAETANAAIEWADAHALRCYLAMSTDKRPKELPARAWLVADGQPAAGAGPEQSRREPGAAVQVRYLAAPAGRCFASIECEMAGRVVKSSATSRESRHFSMVAEPVLEGGPEEILALSESVTGRAAAKMNYGSVVRLLRVTLTAGGSEILSWSVRPRLRVAPAERHPEAMPEGINRVPVPRWGGYAPSALGELGGKVLCVYTDVGPLGRANPAMMPDLHMVRSENGGKDWTGPVRLPVSCATADISPALVRFRGGEYALFWLSDRRGGGYMDLYYSTSLDSKSWTRPRLLEIDNLDTMTGAHVAVDSVSAACRSADVVRVGLAVTGTNQSPFDFDEAYFASGVYLVSVTRARTRTGPELVYSTRNRRIERLPGSPALEEREARLSPSVPLDIAWMAPLRVAAVWGTEGAGPYISGGTVGGEWKSVYTGLCERPGVRVRARICARPGAQGGVLALVARPGGGLQAASSTDGVTWSKPVAVGPQGGRRPGMPGLCGVGLGRFLAVWGHDSATTPSPLWATEFAEPRPPR